MADLFGQAVGSNITSLAPESRRLHLRMAEAILFAAAEPLAESEIAARMPAGVDVAAVLTELQGAYAGRGVNLRVCEGCWAFRTAEDLAAILKRGGVEERRLSRAALETLAIVAYHQPATRAEIEEIRGVSVSKGTLDLLMEAGWVRIRGRRRAPGRPVTYGTTPAFLDHFGLTGIGDLPGLAELKGAGLLDAALPTGGGLPEPDDDERLRPDEEPFEGWSDGEAP